MSTELVKTTPAEAVVVEAEAPPEPMSHIGMMPFFWGEDIHSMDKIEAAGYNTYYILTSRKYSTTVNNVTKTDNYIPTVYRVDKSLISRSVTYAGVDDLKIWTPAQHDAVYYLPPMPWEFREKMDRFFRAAHDKHGTEAILILTYDQTYMNDEDKNPGDGWGCLAPKQENSSTHCNYDIQLVMQDKPEGVDIVGSVHSHPEMPAFFSEVDRKDQADFEGLHITFAWQKGSSATDYHIELIAGGQAWPFKPEQIFAPAPKPELDTTGLDEMLVNVGKKVYPTQTPKSGASTSTTPVGTGAGSRHWESPYNGGSTPGGSSYTKVHAIKLPADSPDPRKTVIIACIGHEAADRKCPFCKVPLSATMWDNGRCIACQSWIMTPDMTINQLLAKRMDRQQPITTDIDPDQATRPIILWYPKESTKGVGTEWSEDMRTTAIIEREEEALVSGTTNPK